MRAPAGASAGRGGGYTRHDMAMIASPALFAFLAVAAPAAPAAAAGAASPATAVSAATAARETAPPLELVALDGARHKLADERGKVVLLNFWATWCMPCRKEMPELAKLQDALAGDGLRVIAAALQPDDEVGDVRRYVNDHHVELPVWVGATDEQMKAFRLPAAVPATVLVDRQGRIAGRISGTVTEAELTPRLRALLAEPATPSAAGAAAAPPATTTRPQ